MSNGLSHIGFDPTPGATNHRSGRDDGRRRNGGCRNPPGGRPRWSPDGKIREAVFKAAGRGVSQDLIADLVGVSESTLKRNCREELKLGTQLAYSKIAMVAFEMALSGDNPQMTRWWLQVRAGWKRS